MTWGICFGLDNSYRIFCEDGCKWKTSERDYDDFYDWPSARAYVLSYYENEAHSELDTIRGQCPGTSDALADACPGHLSSAFCSYKNLSDADKIQLHNDMLTELETRLARTEEKLKEVTENWRTIPPEPKFRKPKSSTEEIEQNIERLKWKLQTEKSTLKVRDTRRLLNRIKKFVRLEKTFHI